MSSAERLWICGATLFDGRGVDQVADVFIEDGRIAGIGAADGDAQRLDARGGLLVPGLCDVHVHFREPGQEYKETVASGARAAARGGMTDVACMPNTQPPIDQLAIVRLIQERAARAGAARVHPIACVTAGQAGAELTEMAELAEAGVVAFSDDGLPVASAEIMRRALEYSRMLGLPIIDHCEEPALAKGGVMHEGVVSTQLGLRGMPAAAEEIMVARDLRLAELTGGHIHLAHMSTAGSVALIRDAKGRGVRVTAEVTPHHLVLTDEAVRSYDPVTKVNPPLRTDADVRALRAALADGTIDLVASDHAPHAVTEKEQEFDLAPFGMIGVETLLPIVWTELVVPGAITRERAIEVMSHAPRRLIGLEEVTFAVGRAADLTLLDPKETWAVDPRQLVSASRNCPFAGHPVVGRVAGTWVAGRQVWAETRAEAI